MQIEEYQIKERCFDEAFSAPGQPHDCCSTFASRLKELTDDELLRRQQSAEFLLRDLGITFTVYGHESGTEKIWPFDLLPRIIDGNEWSPIEQGLKQRIEALNLFVDDIYNDQKIIKDGIVPEGLLHSSKTYRKQMQGFHAPQGAWCHISGVDLIRGGDGEFYVLEDNLRCPSGVSYVLENREILKRTLGNLFEGMNVAPINDYPERLLDTLLSCAPADVDEPNAVLLTPGIYNSAYFEHTFLAQKMGIKLVQGSDLTVRDNRVYMCTTRGLKQVDVIYRRIDDDFLDPKHFNADSMLGIAGVMDVYRAGNVTLANAPGTGVADDKAVYTYVPEIIKYYLDEEAILSNVPTYLCADPKQRQHVLAKPQNFVIKPVNESGGYGIVMGPQASKQELDEVSELVKSNPRNYIAQPMLQLSTVPTLVDGKLQPRHVDLRPFVLCGKETYVMPGGLTRVALREGSMIVNSSQGGGSKDTWVLHSETTNSLPNPPHTAQRINDASSAKESLR
ncbi:MAG: circularly permuted type 2 ATP-grasp protein [Planctomycetota bacterium]